MNADLVLAFVAATALLSLVPGPDMLFVIANGVAGGKRAGITAALGMSTDLMVHPGRRFRTEPAASRSTPGPRCRPTRGRRGTAVPRPHDVARQ